MAEGSRAQDTCFVCGGEQDDLDLPAASTGVYGGMLADDGEIK